ncbi:PI-PLC X domain-containing protein 3 isoform X1 [Periplaneta americana]|uniref:PI-PLC X domain-containing protein 3 isoform X1 n=2 Tax=Periplaneta americana TaxID=6978 RepID=UPI0037E84939
MEIYLFSDLIVGVLNMYEESSSPTDKIGDDLQNWMSLLPETLRNMPVIYLAIPGSHDSGSYSITPSSPMSPDAIPFVRQLARVLGPLVKHFVHNWSVTQRASVSEQLRAGIRYLDLRLATRPGFKQVYFVHGQYGMDVETILREVDAFLGDHEGEIVILDLQHFYAFTPESHAHLMSLLESYFGGKLCPWGRTLTHISLNWMRAKGYQVIALYRDDAARGVPTLWPSNRWPTPWPETTSVSIMLAFLEERLGRRSLDAGFVTQCVLTPDVKFFLKHCFSTLEKKCAEPCNKAVIPWLQKQHSGSMGVNVVICDFVQMEGINFCKTVVQLNAKLLEGSVKT